LAIENAFGPVDGRAAGAPFDAVVYSSRTWCSTFATVFPTLYSRADISH
jgi:hypothetical protein